jgi:hypothetical protein
VTGYETIRPISTGLQVAYLKALTAVRIHVENQAGRFLSRMAVWRRRKKISLLSIAHLYLRVHNKLWMKAKGWKLRGKVTSADMLHMLCGSVEQITVLLASIKKQNHSICCSSALRVSEFDFQRDRTATAQPSPCTILKSCPIGREVWVNRNLK